MLKMKAFITVRKNLLCTRDYVIQELRLDEAGSE